MRTRKTLTTKLTTVGAAALLALGAAACEVEDGGGDLEDPGLEDPTLDEGGDL